MPFTSTDQQTTSVSKAHWFALPDGKFTAPPECTYTIVCEATVKGKKIKGTKQWTVWIDPSGGLTERPTLTGQVTITSMQKPLLGGKPGEMETIWYVKDKGSLSRSPAFIKMLPPTTSQFYNKIKVHEERHVWQWNTGGWKDYFSPDVFFNSVKDIKCNFKTGAEEYVRKAVKDKWDAYMKNEKIRADNTAPARETDAHNESDKIPPDYRLYPENQ